MTQRCQICLHSKRLEIDREIVAGKTLARIAKEYGVSENSLYNHRDNHISRQLKTSFEQRQLLEGDFLLSKIDTLIQRTESIFKRNYDKNRDGMALKALSESRQTFELLCKISYALHESRLAELKMNAEYGIQQAREDVSKALEVLTDDELRLYGLINQKIISKDKSIDVVNQFKPALPDLKSDPTPNPNKGKEPERTKENPITFDSKEQDSIPEPDLKLHLPFQRKKRVRIIR